MSGNAPNLIPGHAYCCVTDCWNLVPDNGREAACSDCAPPAPVPIHVFNALGQHEGFVRRRVSVRTGAATVRISHRARPVLVISGRGRSVVLGEKARLPHDLKP